MANNLPPIRRLDMQDVIASDGQIDPERLLSPLNLFMEATYEILDGNVLFDSNVRSLSKQLLFTTKATYVSASDFDSVSLNSEYTAIGVLLLRIYERDAPFTIIKDPVTLQWSQQGTVLKITFVTGLKDSTAYNLTIMVI